jgi:tetratricopeptide (TPR) repeat protein
VPLLAMSAASAVITLVVSETAGALETLEGLPMPARLAGAFNGYQWYLRKTFWPSGLAVFYPHAGGLFSPFESAWSVAAIFGLTVLAFIIAGKRPYFLAGWLWYLTSFLPVIGLVQVGVQAVADRYAYLPLTGIFIALAWGLRELGQRNGGWRAPLACLSAAVIVALSVAAIRQVSFWRDEATLYGHGLAVTRDNFVLRYNLGLALDKSGRHEEALEQFAEALRVKPEWDMAHLSAGRAYYAMGRNQEALASYGKAIASNPDWAEAYHELGMVQFQLGRYAESIESFTKASGLKPNMTEVYNNMGTTYVKLNQPLKAIASFNQAISLDRFNDKAYMNLALVYIDIGDRRAARVQYDALLRFKPDSARELKAFLDYGAR